MGPQEEPGLRRGFAGGHRIGVEPPIEEVEEYRGEAASEHDRHLGLGAEIGAAVASEEGLLQLVRHEGIGGHGGAGIGEDERPVRECGRSEVRLLHHVGDVVSAAEAQRRTVARAGVALAEEVEDPGRRRLRVVQQPQELRLGVLRRLRNEDLVRPATPLAALPSRLLSDDVVGRVAPIQEMGAVRLVGPAEGA